MLEDLGQFMVLLVVGVGIGSASFGLFLVLREFWGWFYGWTKRKNMEKKKENNTMTQLHCNGCKKVTWHRRKLHDHVCNTCDTSRRVEGSDRTIML
jgi:hypothetical protein